MKLHIKILTIMTFILILGFSITVFGQSREIDILSRRGLDGDVNAQSSLGIMYYYGNRAPQNYKMSFFWYKMALSNGATSAQYPLGILLLYGRGVEKNIKKAIEMFQKAAENGNSNADYQLGNLYYQGKGVPKDFEMAFSFYSKATEKNHKYAPIKLGDLYASGEGVKKNYVKAFAYYELALSNVELGYKNSQIVSAKRDEIKTLLLPHQLRQAKREAKSLIWK